MRIKESKTELSIKPLRLLWSFKGNANVRDLSINIHNQKIVSADAAGDITVLSAVSGEILSRWSAYELGAFCCQWSSQGEFLAVSGQDSKVYVYDAGALSLVTEIIQGSSWVDSLTWHAKEDQFLAGSGKTLKLWTAKGFLLQQFEDHQNAVSDVAWNPANLDSFATCTYFGIKLWNKSNSKSSKSFEWDGAVINLSYSPDAKILASGCQGGAVQAWRLPDGEDFFMSGYTTKVRQLAWDSTSRFLATGGGVEIIVWDFSGSGPVGTQPRIFFGHKEFVSALAFAPNEAKLVSGDLSGDLYVRNLADGDTSASFASNDSSVSQIVFFPDGKNFVVGFLSGEIKCYSAELT